MNGDTHRALRARLVGNWELVNITQNKLAFPFGRGALGHLTYTDCGMMCVAIFGGGRLTLPIGPSGTVSTLQVMTRPASWLTWWSIFLRHVSYCGRYELQGQDEVLHHVEASNMPGWAGGVLRRQVAFDGDDLILRGGVGKLLAELRWRRIARHQPLVDRAQFSSADRAGNGRDVS